MALDGGQYLARAKPVPRQYQARVINTALNWFASGATMFDLQIAVGGGKSMVIGWIAEALIRKPANKVLVLSARTTIIKQLANEIARIIPLGDIGVACTSTGSMNVNGCRVLVASIGTIISRQHLLAGVTHVLIDEAQEVGSDDDAMYRQALKALAAGRAKVCGLTGTPKRLKGDYGFRRRPIRIDIKTLKDAGVLVPMNVVQPDEEYFSMRGIKSSGGDYSATDAHRAMDRQRGVSAPAQWALPHLPDPARSMWFCTTIKHCQDTAAALDALGVHSVAYHSKLSAWERHEADALIAGRRHAIVSVGALTTGFNAPWITSAVLLRPTKSVVLHEQMIGRIIRGFDGKRSAALVDLVGNVKRLGDPTTRSTDAEPDGACRCKQCSATSPRKRRRCACGGNMEVSNVGKA